MCHRASSSANDHLQKEGVKLAELTDGPTAHELNDGRFFFCLPQGDEALRYFLEPVILAVNYGQALGWAMS